LEHYFTNNDNLKSEIKTLTYKQDLYDFSFASDNGVFAKSKIDYGSICLVNTILKENGKYNNLLDVGCGYGFIGIVLAKIFTIPAHLTDINKRALHLAEMNIKTNKVDGKVFESNVYSAVSEKYDLIVTNPPIRAGKQVVLDILQNAKEYLSKDGELWFVIRKDQGAKSIEKILNDVYNLSIMEKSKGFYIFKAKKR
jgi:16S rRNA (guanine1207-N2)-methyltransferase